MFKYINIGAALFAYAKANQVMGKSSLAFNRFDDLDDAKILR